MKKPVSILLILSLLLSLSSCSGNESMRTVQFYYCEKEVDYSDSDSVIALEDRDFPSDQSDYLAILNVYLSGPITDTYVSPFPKSTSLISLTINADTAEAILSDNLADLTGIELSIACTCFGMTVQKLTQVSTVKISAETEPLGNQPFIVINPESYLLQDLDQA